ncbi:hypothetical protein AOR01nite_06850 [Acetobacter orleanensis]|uniref:Uncharacterized protein n=1 Tax=Acetobacter orleanensis TaxID=104099 RepID=A0A4Y3TKA8_9PROT|nr:hypothetical protein Abol_030_031 [Acetobacter orleanensis JCM 7639]GEB82208.1 hypothetical protein AOR01nite_06850 [Acetobacter orleanensis]
MEGHWIRMDLHLFRAMRLHRTERAGGIARHIFSGRAGGG